MLSFFDDIVKGGWRALRGQGRSAADIALRPRNVSEAYDVIKKAGPEEARRLVGQLPQRRKGSAFVVQALGETPEEAGRYEAMRLLTGNTGGRYRLGRLTGQVVPEEALPAGAGRGLGERRLMAYERAGKPLPGARGAGIVSRSGQAFMRRSLPAKAAIVGAGLGVPAYALAGRLGGADLSRPEGLSPEMEAAILASIGSGMTEEQAVNKYYDDAIAAAAQAYSGVDPEVEAYMRSRAAEYERAGLAQSTATAQALAALAGTPIGGSSGQAQAMANQIAAAGAMPTGTDVSSLTPVSADITAQAAGTAEDAARAAGAFAAREQMNAEDLAYLSGVAQLMGVEFGQDLNRRIEDALMAERIAASRAAREAQAVLTQQKLETLGNISRERARSGVGAVSVPELQQTVYAIANEWNRLSQEQKQLEASRRQLMGTDDASMQQEYIVSRLRDLGLVA